MEILIIINLIRCITVIVTKEEDTLTRRNHTLKRDKILLPPRSLTNLITKPAPTTLEVDEAIRLIPTNTVGVLLESGPHEAEEEVVASTPLPQIIICTSRENPKPRTTISFKKLSIWTTTPVKRRSITRSYSSLEKRNSEERRKRKGLY